MAEVFTIGSYVEGNEVKTNRFVRGYLAGYVLLDKTNPSSLSVEINITNSKTVYITMESIKLVSPYETLLKALKDCGLDYKDGKIVGCHHPKFCTGDIARHKNYGDLEKGNIVITYVSEQGYSYRFQDGSGGGTFGFSLEDDYNLVVISKSEN